MKLGKEIFEIIIHARGGQGGKVAAEIIAQAAAKEGKFIQAFPQFGPERSGAPTRTFVRISEKKIRTHEPIVDPDLVMVLDETIIDSVPVAHELDRHDTLIINSRKSKREIADKMEFKGKVFPVDATGISMEVIGQARPNTVILGKFVQVSEMVKLESISDEFRKIFSQKIGEEITEKNVKAIEKAYDTI